jgi:multiple antibiotic resistance protein
MWEALNLSVWFLVFIPLFVAIDALGTVPFFFSLTRKLKPPARYRLLRQAIATAFLVAILFLVGGQYVFSVMGITENDFRVGGGVVLLILAINDLLFSKGARQNFGNTLGVVPIGIPLIMGPAALTTILILVKSYGYTLTIFSLLVNLLIVWLMFRFSDKILKLLGEAGAQGFAKVMALLMAAIAIKMIRLGLSGFLGF